MEPGRGVTGNKHSTDVITSYRQAESARLHVYGQSP